MTMMVMTGGSSGLGAAAAERLAAAPGVRLIVGARGTAGRRLPQGVESLEVDLASLDQVRAFAGAVAGRLDDDGRLGSIDGLVLNAGLSFPQAGERTAEGFEPTFGVNHLAHYLLTRLLVPHLSDGATVVFTTSGTHDPEQETALPPPRHADARMLADPGQDPDRDPSPAVAAGRAYSASKLCNILTARALAERSEVSRRGIRVVTFDPGPTPGTGLARDRGSVVRLAWWLLGSPVGRLVPAFSTRAAAGGRLADLALGGGAPPPGQSHVRLRRGKLAWVEPSEMARDDEVGSALWRDSAELVGIEP